MKPLKATTRKRIIATNLIQEISSYSKARSNGNEVLCIHHLGRAHILSQRHWFRHFYIHFLMLEYSLHKKDRKEAVGQLIRIIVVVPSHIFKKIPKGNTGWSNVGLMESLPLPKDLSNLFDT